MLSNIINLLPREYTRVLQREYFLRLSTLTVFGLAAVVIINAILLIPSLFYLQREIWIDTNSLNQLSHTFATQEEKQVNDQLATLSQQSAYLSKLSGVPTASATINSILAVPHTDITLTSFSFIAPTKNTPGTLVIQGTAPTREALSAYNASLKSLSFVKDANVPISDYAQASTVPFTDTLTLSFPQQ